MAVATNELKKPSMSIGAVAEAVGYQSEAAFRRAFKRHMGVTPAQMAKNPEHIECRSSPQYALLINDQPVKSDVRSS
jgi:AraC-like DNA-binding protein